MHWCGGLVCGNLVCPLNSLVYVGLIVAGVLLLV